MWELTKRISLRTLSVLSKVEPEPDLSTGSGSGQKVPTPAPQHCLKSTVVGRYPVLKLQLVNLTAQVKIKSVLRKMTSWANN